MNRLLVCIRVSVIGIIVGISPLQAAQFYVSLSGSDGAGDGSQGRPWRTLRHACSRVAPDQGHVIHLGPGTFVESGRCDLPSGVSLQGAGKAQTVLTASAGFYRNSYSGYDGNLFLLRIRGVQQQVSNLTLDGAGKNIYGGLMVQDSRQIEISQVRIQAFFFNGLWLWNTQEASFHDGEVYDCSWGSTAWAGGAIHLYKLKNVDLYNLKLTEIEQRNGQKGGGLAVKALGPGNDNVCENVRIYDCDVRVNPFGIWQNGVAPNISIEFWNVITKNCEIFRSTIRQHVSLVSITPEQSAALVPNQFRFRVYQNQLLCEGSYPLEISMSSVEVAHNYVDAAWTGYAIANWEKRGTLYENWHVHHNVFVQLGSGWPSSVIQSRGGLKNLRFEYNTLHLEGPPIGIFTPYGPNTSQNIVIAHNVFLRTRQTENRTEPNQDYLIYPKTHEGVHALSGVTLENNIYGGFNARLSPHISGLTQSGNQVADPGFKMAGQKPFPYYEPREGSLAQSLNAGARPLTQDSPAPPPIEPPAPPPGPKVEVALRINAGGSTFTSPEGYKFWADTLGYVKGDTKIYRRRVAIKGTENELLYQSERWGKTFQYEIPLPPGTYDITLHFAEIYWMEDDTRIMEVNIEGGDWEIQGLDVHKTTGRFAAHTQTFSDVSVEDGLLNLEFVGVQNVAQVSALEIIGLGTIPQGDPEIPAGEALRINCGSSEDQLIGGTLFRADAYYGQGSATWKNTTIEEIANTAWDALYTTERYGTTDQGSFRYQIPVANGTYTLKLHLAEIYFGAPGGYDQVSGVGRRIFHITAEGKTLESNLDLAQNPGPATARVEQHQVTVSDGVLTLELRATLDRPKLSAFEIIPQ